MNEIWKSLCGLVENGDYYEVSCLGNIRSIDRVDNRNHKVKGRLLSKTKDKDGYLQVGLSLNGKMVKRKVHRLVALAFISNVENKLEVNHIDGNKENNNVDNLEWSTSSENKKHAYDIGLKNAIIGESQFKSKLTEDDVIWIRNNHIVNDIYFGDIAMSKKFNVSKSTINLIVHRKLWKHI